MARRGHSSLLHNFSLIFVSSNVWWSVKAHVSGLCLTFMTSMESLDPPNKISVLGRIGIRGLLLTQTLHSTVLQESLDFLHDLAVVSPVMDLVSPKVWGQMLHVLLCGEPTRGEQKEDAQQMLQGALARNVSNNSNTILDLEHAHVCQTHTIFSLESFGFANW